MTKLVLLMTLLSMAFLSQAQRNSFGVVIGTGKGLIVQQAAEGTPDTQLNWAITLGLQYDRIFNDQYTFETGLVWYKNMISVTPAFYPGIDMTSENYELQLLYVPLFMKVNFSKQFFINGGLLGDIDITSDKYISNQTGLGVGLGLGMEFPITNKIAMSISPALKLHGMILANQSNFPQRLLESGIMIVVKTK